MGALVPRGRVARAFTAVCLGLIALGGIAAVTLYVLVATGTVTADIATPYIERALEERIGGGHKVAIGSTSIQTMADGATAVVVHDIRVTARDGQLVASAPSAEVELEGSLLSLMPKARRIDLVGAEMTVRIAASGHLAVATGRGGKPLSTARTAPNAPPALRPDPAPAAPSPATPAPALQPSAPPAAAPAPAAADMDPLKPVHLARWMAELESAGFDGGALADVGLKDGTLVVENESSGRRIVFQHISIRLARPAGGGAELTFTTQSPQGVATAVARIGAAKDGERAIDVAIRNVSTYDLLQAFAQDHRRFYIDTPLSAAFTATLSLEGELKAAKASLDLGAGALGNGEEVEERFVIDRAQIGLTLDVARRVILLSPILAQKGENRIALEGEIRVPALAREPWPFTIGPKEVVLAGPEMSEPALVIDKVTVAGRFDPPSQKLFVETGFLGSAAGSFTFTALFDFGVAAPTLAFDGTATPLPVATIKRFWPVSIAPPARQFAIENVSAGTADGISIAVRLPLDLIGQKQIPLPEDGVRFTLNGTGVTLRPVKGLPPITNASLAILVTGRSVRITMADGTVVTPQNRKIAVSDGVMLLPDYFPREPASQIQVKFEGPADAAVEVLGMEQLKGPTGTAFDPSTTRGRFSALLQVNITFRKVGRPEDFDYSLEATLTDFGVDKVFKGQRLEGATVRAFASPGGIVLRGDGKLAGAPVAFEYEKKKDVADSDIRISATLDEAARARLGVDLPGITGPVGVRLVGTTNNKDTRASIEADLTNARIADVIPGLSKPAGKPLKARFVINDKGKTVRLDDLVMDGSGTLLKGSLELSDSGELLGAQFPTFQLSDGDKASLKADRAGDVLKIRITGEVMDARGIMKSLVATPSGPRRPKTPDVDVEARIGALTGNNGEVLRQFDLTVARRGVETRDFTLTARAGRDGTVAGEMRNWQGRQRALQVSSSDAGALLRFLDIYPKVQGGEAWLVVDPPRSDQTPQEGVLHLRDFSIKGEPGLERLSSAARDSSGKIEDGTAVFEKAQAQFARTTGKIVFREGAIWGPSVGATFDGTLDFAADRISVRGTFVPAYALNNIFSKLPVIGMLLGGGPNEGLVGVTFEIVGPLTGGPTLRINPISAVAPGFLRKIFEFRDSSNAPPTR
ncbi:AsmA-like C-terminal region-containing protein [Xanthobacter sp. AM11]|uniref:YhdP family protein n=1 Tax=Xanthobacter sp. AM11 TaxID=3380643 RepID=UPI0039BFE7FD